MKQFTDDNIIEMAVKVVSGYLPQKHFIHNGGRYQAVFHRESGELELLANYGCRNPAVRVCESGLGPKAIYRFSIIRVRALSQSGQASWSVAMNKAAHWFASEVLRVADRLADQYSDRLGLGAVQD